MQRADWPPTSVWRKSDLPTVMLLALRFASTVAPASAPKVEGDNGTHRSSHTSAWIDRPRTSVASKIRSLPNGTVSPSTVVWRPRNSRAARNWRSS